MNDTPMPEEEGFLRRWSRLKAHPAPAPFAAPRTPDAVAQSATSPDVSPALAPALTPAAQAARPDVVPPAPTFDDVALLTPQSDFSAFVARGVDPAVRRLALKKLFADPNFAVMDGLDIYIDDYTKPSPLTGAMLASLRHAPGVLAHLFGESDASRTATEDGATDPAPASDAAPVSHDDMPPGPGHSPQGNA